MSDAQHDYFILYEQSRTDITEQIRLNLKLESEIEKLKAEKSEFQKQINMIVDALIVKNEKLTRQRDIMKKALEWRFKHMHFTSIIINDEAANMANSCLDELMKEALQEAEGME